MKPVEKPGEARGRAGEVPNLSTGIARLQPSTIIFHALYRPIEFLRRSTEISCCLPYLLSVYGNLLG